MGGQRYDREGLYQWARQRFPGVIEFMTEEDFRTQARHRLNDQLLEVSRKFFPKIGQEQIDAQLDDAFSGTQVSEAEDARELVEWAILFSFVAPGSAAFWLSSSRRQRAPA